MFSMDEKAVKKRKRARGEKTDQEFGEIDIILIPHSFWLRQELGKCNCPFGSNLSRAKNPSGLSQVSLSSLDN